jgi:hypothetical protein
MARIGSFPIDKNIQDQDAWIGTEATNRVTRQFTAQGVADYLNINSKISISAQMVFKFVQINAGGGDITDPLDNNGATTLDFTKINTIRMSVTSNSGMTVTEFMAYIDGSQILINEQKKIDEFGHYKITSYVLDAVADPLFATLTLEYLGGTGLFVEGKTYDTASFFLSKGVDVFIGATNVADGTSGIVPKPLATQEGTYLKGDGKWTTIPIDPNTTYDLDVPVNTTSINLAGSDGTNDAVSLFGGGNINITRDNANKITFTGTDTGLTDVVLAIGDSVGAPLTFNITATELTLTSMAYTGGTNVGYVPIGGDNTLFLRGDGSWIIPPQPVYNWTVVDSVGDTGAVVDEKFIKFVTATGPLGTALTGGGGSLLDPFLMTLSSPDTQGAESFTNTNAVGSFVAYGTVNAAATGAVDIGGVNLTATGVASGTTFLRGDNIWATPIDTQGVETFTNEDGTYISAGTVNTSATGDVTMGIIDLSAVNGATATAATRFLSADNKWEVPIYTDPGVVSITTTDGSFIDLTPTTASDGAVTVTADLSAGGTANNTTFLRGDNNWTAVPIDPTMTSTVLGLGKLFSDTVQTIAASAVSAVAAKTYGAQFNSSEQLVVNVPWTDTQNAFQTITGAGSDNTDSGILLSDSGGTVLVLGAGSVSASQTGNTITLTGVNTVYDYWILSDGISTTNISSQATAAFLAGTYITTTESSGNLTISHNATSRTDTTSTASPSSGGTVDLVSSVSTGTEGHVTAIDVKTVTWPSDTDTNYILNKAAGSTDLILSADGTTQNTIQFAGTTNEVTVTGVTEDAYQIGLPDDVTIGGELTVIGTSQSSFSGQVTIPSTPSAATDAASKAYVDGLVAGGLTFKGTFNASTGEILSGTSSGSYLYQLTATPPAPFDPSAARVEVAVGDFYVVETSAGQFYGNGGTGGGGADLDIGDSVIGVTAAAVNASVSTDWSIIQSDEGVTDFSNTFGTFITGTNNSNAPGAVSLGTIDLVNNGADAPGATNFYRGDGKWITPTDTLYDLEGIGTTNATVGFTLNPLTGANDDILLTGDGTVVTTSRSGNVITITGTNTEYGIFTAATAVGNGAPGLVPGPLAATFAAPTTYFLNADATFSIPTGTYTLPVATTAALGGIKIGYTEAGKNYPLELDNEKAFVNVPWTDTLYTLPVATSIDLGGVKIGYTDNAKNYAVELDSDQMYVNVPWTDTPYVLPLAANGTRGGVQIGYTQAATRDYPVTLDSEKMLVTVPWTDTQNPNQTLLGTGSDNSDSGIILNESGGTVLVLGAGSVTAAQSSDTITLTGVNTWVANSLNVAGYVAAPGAVANKVWKTDASGNPAWRTDDTGGTGTVTSVTAGTGMTQTGTSTINPTLNVIGGNGITVNADNLLMSGSYTGTFTATDLSGGGAAVTGVDAALLDGFDHTQFGATLATYGTTAGSSGRIRCTAPFATNSGKMFMITVDVWQGYSQSTYKVSGYMYSTIDQWYTPQAVYTGTGTPNIIVGRDTNGKAYISIANGNYTGVRVHSMTRGYVTSVADTYDPWTISITGGTENSVTPAIYNQTGTVKSVAISHAGNAFGISGSPVTSTGTLGITMGGNSSQYIDGAGNLTAFPSIPPDPTGNYLLLSGGNMSGQINAQTINFDGIVSGSGAGGQIGRNHAYDTLELKGYGAELMIGCQNTTLHVNYRTCNNGASGNTPTDWFWRAGSSTSLSNHSFGTVNATTLNSTGTTSLTGIPSLGNTAPTRVLMSNNTDVKYNDLPTARSQFNLSYDTFRRIAQTTDTNYWVGTKGWGNQSLNTTIPNMGSGFFDVWSNPAGAPNTSEASHWVGSQAFHYTRRSDSGNYYGWQTAMGSSNPAYMYVRGIWSGTGWGSWYRMHNDKTALIKINDTIKLSTDNDRNLKLQGNSSSDGGFTGYASNGAHLWQLYGSGSEYGFLNGNWGAWDLRKTKGGNLYMNNNNTYYLNTLSNSFFNGNLSIGTQNTNYGLFCSTAISGTNIYANSNGGSFVFGASTSEGEYISRPSGTSDVIVVAGSSERLRVKDTGALEFTSYTATNTSSTPGTGVAPVQNYSPAGGIMSDTTSDLGTMANGDIVRTAQEATFEFTRAEMNALATGNNGGTTLINAPGSNKFVMIEKATFLIYYSYNSTTVSTSQRYEIQQDSDDPNNADLVAFMTGETVNAIVYANGAASAYNYGTYENDTGRSTLNRTYRPNKATTLRRITTSSLATAVTSIRIKLRYRVWEAGTF